MTILSLSVLRLVGLLSPIAAGDEATPPRELWAGHQITFGVRDIPFKGEVVTRTDTFVLARAQRSAKGIELSQFACRVLIERVAGVQVSIDHRALPSSRVTFVPSENGFVADSEVVWGEEDIDGDGHPGMTVEVDAPVCSGEIYVDNHSTTHATATHDGTRLRGNANVHVIQHVLGTKGRCLAMTASDTNEHVQGPFAYVAVPSGTTCASLRRDGWPVDAETK